MTVTNDSRRLRCAPGNAGAVQNFPPLHAGEGNGATPPRRGTEDRSQLAQSPLHTSGHDSQRACPAGGATGPLSIVIPAAYPVVTTAGIKQRPTTTDHNAYDNCTKCHYFNECRIAVRSGNYAFCEEVIQSEFVTAMEITVHERKS